MNKNKNAKNKDTEGEERRGGRGFRTYRRPLPAANDLTAFRRTFLKNAGWRSCLPASKCQVSEIRPRFDPLPDL
jgi:hypothetical protein